jgi:hypothetical protein
MTAKPYKICTFSLYEEDIAYMNQVVKGLKRDGYTKANKSWLLRQALHAFDTTTLPPPENY